MLGRIDGRPWLPALAYLVVALYLLASSLGSFSTRFIGSDSGDVYEMARHIWWYSSALRGGQDIFQHELLGHPEGFPAIQLWAHPLQFFPCWLLAFFMPLAAAYNVGIILTLVLNGCAMYLLARRRLLTNQRFPAFLAGLIFMLFPAIQGHLFGGHFGLLAQWQLPLFIIMLYDYADHGGTGRYFKAVAFFLLCAMGHSLQLIFALAPLSLLFLLARWYRRDHVGMLRLIAVLALGCASLLVFLSPILGESLRDSPLTAVGGYTRYSIDLLGVVSPSFANPFWKDITGYAATVLGTNLAEGASYLGLAAGCLALLGIGARREARFWLLVALAAWILALGPLLKIFDQVIRADIAGYEAVVPLPYALLIRLPIVELARTPGRFMLLAAPAFALLAGFGAAAICSSHFIERRHRYTRAALALLAVFAIIEDYRLFGEFPTVPAEIAPEIHDLRGRRDIRAIYNAPHDHLLAAKEAMYLQTAHGKPLIGGHDTRVTPVDPARLELLASFRPPLLNEADADVVIINKARAEEMGQPELLARARQWLGAPFFEDSRYALFETPFIPEQTPKLHSSAWDGQTHVTHIYKQQPGWMEFSAVLEAADRRARLSLDGTPLETLQVRGRIPISIPLPIASSGYHSFRIALDPPCPERIDTDLLRCQGVTIDSVDTRILTNGAIYNPIRIADGIELAGYYLPKQIEDEVAIRLWWRFDSPRTNNDVRFVHVLDERGLPVSERPGDRSFGEIAAGSELTETLRLDASALANGEYRVLTGWYELPFAIRYDVLSNVDGAENDTIVLGSIRVRH